MDLFVLVNLRASSSSRDPGLTSDIPVNFPLYNSVWTQLCQYFRFGTELLDWFLEVALIMENMRSL